MSEIPGKVIMLDQIEAMFKDIQAQGQWDLSKTSVWSYYFTHATQKKLENTMIKLHEMGYTIGDIFLADKDNDTEEDVYFLHVEKVEIHDCVSLDKRNDELYLFAHEQGLGSYDGMDVAPLEEE